MQLDDLKGICDGFHGDYATFFGTSEAQPVVGIGRIDNPTHFIRQQEKIVQEEDLSWAGVCSSDDDKAERSGAA